MNRDGSSHEGVNLNPLPRLRASIGMGSWQVDILAGATVAVFAIPQAMAYAVLAGLPPVHGLYAAIAMSILAALWGSSPFINTGPTNTAALLTAAALAPAIASGLVTPLAGVFAVGLLAGIIRVLMGILRMGWLIKFVPVPAFLGFITAAEFLIAFGQLHELLGVPAPTATLAPLRILEVLFHLPQTDLRAFFIGAGVCVLLLFSKRLPQRVPMSLVSLVLASLTALLFEKLFPSTRPIMVVRHIAEVPSQIFSFQLHFPPLEVWWAVLPGAAAVAVIGLIEAVSIGQNLAHKYKTELNFDQEFFGQGIAQVGSTLLGGIPGSGSFSRSALLETTGAKTPLANIFFGIFTASALMLFPRAIEMVPLSALAGLLFYTGIRMFNPAAVMQVWRTSRADFSVFAITFLITFGGKIEWGFFVGIIVSMAIFLSRARELQLYELVPHETDSVDELPRFQELPYSPDVIHEPSDVVALALHGDLFFGLAHELRRKLAEISRTQQPRFIVVRTRRAHSIDYSCWKAIFDFAQMFQSEGGTLILTGVRDELRNVIEVAGMDKVFPPENLVPPKNAAWRSFETGLGRVGERLDESARLSIPWQKYFVKRHQRNCTARSLSNWRDPYNDAATLGIVENHET